MGRANFKRAQTTGRIMKKLRSEKHLNANSSVSSVLPDQVKSSVKCVTNMDCTWL